MRYETRLLLCLGLVFATPPFCQAQLGDFNGDGNYDCQDIDELTIAIADGSVDPRYDLSGDGRITHSEDVGEWLAIASESLGYEVGPGDANLDGGYDVFDLNITSMNYWRETDRWCRANFNGDGVTNGVDRADWSTNWQQGGTTDRPSAEVERHEHAPQTAWKDDGAVIGSTEAFDIVVIPQKAPDGFFSSVVAFRQKDETHRFTAVEGVQISGDVHQSWSSLFFSGTSTVDRVKGSALYDPAWASYDSHILLDQPSIAFGIYQPNETNDRSDPQDQADQLPPLDTTARAVLGIGDIEMLPTDAFALDWNDNLAFFELTKIVTPARMQDTGEAGEVSLRVGVHSADAALLPTPDVGVIGIDGSFVVPFFARPCDLDTDGDCDQPDLDLMLSSLGKYEPAFDLNQSGGTVDLQDVEVWNTFADGLVANVILGDANFDGIVNAADLNALALNWQSTGDYGWSGGDFDGNGIADAADANIIGLNWQRRSDPAAAVVPEPSCLFQNCLPCIWFALLVRKHRITRGKT